MNAENALKLARRFIELPQEKRHLFLDGLRGEGVDFSLLPIPASVAAPDRDALSYAQRRMWFLWRLDPHGAAYNLPMAVRLKGELDRAALQSAFDALVARHETLRTRFRQEGDEVRQQVLEPAPVAIGLEDLQALSPGAREQRVGALAEAEAQAPFDLAEGPLLRVRLLKLAEREHVLLLTLHHIVADGWSLNLLIDEFLRLYDAACAGADAALSTLPIQYRDYALWQRSWLEAGERERQLAYWRDKLGDEHAPLDLPTDRPRPAVASHRGARHEFQVEARLADRLRMLARRHNVTLFMVLLAAFKLLLQRYSGQSAIRVGVPIANRHRAEVEGLIGCFINTQVLHTEIDPLIDIAELLRRVRETALGAQAHQDLPFEQLVEALDLDRATGQSPLFQVLFNHQSNVADVGELTTRSGLTLERVESARHAARFDLALDTYESAGRLHAALTYALDLFDGTTIARLEEHWLRLLEGIAEEGAAVVGELPLAQAPETEPVEYSQEEGDCVHHLIERAASQHPQRVAATSGDEAISYARLNQRADELARVLLEAGVLPDQRVGVVGDRSLDMLVGILGILKAGAAYLPFEPEHPQERQAFMLADGGVRLVLGCSSWGGTLPDGVRMLCLDQPLPPASGRTELPVRVSPANLAYVVYTSGTTGTPKGVAISHGALANYVEGISRRLPLDAIQSMAMVSTPAADLGHTVLYGALCAGRTLHLLDKETVLDAEAFAARMAAHEVDALKIVPSHLAAMLSSGRSALPRRCLILGGEACPPALLDRIADLAPELTVLNHYGPTETTVGVLSAELSGLPELGTPLENSGVQVLDACLQAVPGSTRGELYISGAGLARGYLGRPALTAERFVPDPAGAPGARMYRTGDWVGRNGGGELLFAGRLDGQVKIRGYRVELTEIENRLRAFPGVGNALLRVVGEEQARQLAAYLVPATALDDQAQQAFLEEVRAALKRALPEHMVPAYLLVLERLPVTANGKVDLKALPEPVAVSAAYVAPGTPLQMQLAEIWAEVLRVEQVGLTDNFFALGGHSLLATQVVSRARKRLSLDIPLRILFDTADLQAFAVTVQELEQALDVEIERVDRDSPLPVSHAQHRQWLFWKLHPQSTAYNTPLAVRMRGALDRQALQGALDALVIRHEALRTVFHEENGLLWQRIVPASPGVIGYEDLDGQDETVQAQRLEEEAFAPFDLEQGPLIRARLFKVDEDEHLLAVTLHHIVSDGWSMSVMVREFAAAYNARAAGQVQDLQPLPVQYADYAAWQRQRLAAGQMQSQLAYWKTKLEDDFEILELPADRTRPQVQSYRGGRVDIPLPTELTASLRRLAVEANATLFHVFLATFAILLSRYSGRDTINIGVPVTNRNRLELEGLIGFFVNSIVARIGLDHTATFSQLLMAVKQTTLEAQANKDIPFDVLVEELKPERGLGHNPLFQVMYNHLRDFGEQVAPDSLQGLHAEEIALVERTAQFDISLNTLERSDGVVASFSYSSDLFEADRIERLAKHWVNLLHSAVREPERHVAELLLLDADEYQNVVLDWNRNEADYPSDHCIHQLIEDQVERTPNATALIFGEQELSYRELNLRANRLAHRLRELGVSADRRVGIAMERSLEMVVGLLAILKAGGAYVPLDPEYPGDRLSYMLEDSQAILLLSQSSLRGRLPEGIHPRIVWLDELSLAGCSADNPVCGTVSGNLAYSIYTSGSTGRPKGVLIEHRNAVALIAWARMVYKPEDLHGVLASTSICFDLSVWEIFVTLSAGGYAVLADDALGLPRLAAKDRVRLINTVPSAIKALHDSGQLPGTVRTINLAGEALKQSLVDDLHRSGNVQQVYDLYGPSEDTTYSTFTLRAPGGRANIGRPISNTAVYLLDGAGQPVPVGVAGELCLAGAGLARGYMGRPALTAEKFLPNSFDDYAQGSRLYRTGDLARYRADGMIEYLGRIDHQVKIRGFRIELGEIEAQLHAHDSIHEAVVVDFEGVTGDRQLVAYLVPSDPALVSSDELHLWCEALRSSLKESLPDYMVPAHLLVLETLPLTPNGKLDRKALPKPDAGQLRREYVAPRTQLESQLATIWGEVLHLERVGLTDNFFDLGGHSLLATQVISRVRQVQAVELPLRALFEAPLFADFVQQVERGGRVNKPAFSAVDRGQPLPLSYAQQRQWFLWKLEPNSSAYHIPSALRLTGRLDVAALQRSFDALIARHETLRTTFRHEEEHVMQVIHSERPCEMALETLEKTDQADIRARVEAEIRTPFDLEKGPLLRVRLLSLEKEEHILVLTLHHIIADGWSLPIMVDELVQLYEGYRTGHPVLLPDLPIQYADYAAWQRMWMEAGERERQLAYWTSQLNDGPQVLEFPTDHPRPALQRYEGARVSVELDSGLVRQLRGLAQQHNVTLFMLLLASFQVLLHRYSGQSHIRVGVPIANRTQMETERLIGFFVNTQVLTADFDVHMSFADVLAQTKRVALGAQGHQDLPFEQLVEVLQPERSLSHSPLFQVMFNHQVGSISEVRQVPGLHLEVLQWDSHTAQFDLSLDTFEAEDGLWASMNYAVDMFERATVERLVEHWINVLKNVVRYPDSRVSELQLLGADEYRKVVIDWNHTQDSRPADFNLCRLFEIQVERRPEATALILGDRTLSYGELNRKANQLAYRLRELGVGPDVLVGIAVARSLEMVVGLLGVLKSGGAYVPLDPEYPRERLAFMLEDSGATLLLTQTEQVGNLVIPGGMQVLYLDREEDWLSDSDSGDVPGLVQPENLAYVMYTSGSTGRPKGVCISQSALTRHASIALELFELVESDRVLQFATFNFDGFVEQLYPALICGAAVVMRGRNLWDSGTFHRELVEKEISVVDLTTAYWFMLAKDFVEKRHAGYGRLRQVHVGGEAMPPEGVSAWRQAGLEHVRLLNTYGPTEATVTVSAHDCGPYVHGQKQLPALMPIGKVLPGRSMYVLDCFGNVVAGGAIGELVIGGELLARSYHGRPGLTSERFMPDPFSDIGGARLYRTGDLARYRDDGVIEYVGRLDHQVKIRGFRIELGEIEACLLALDTVREAVVLAQDGAGGKQLVAYVVLNGPVIEAHQDDLRENLRAALRASLPEYMVPTCLLFLDVLPCSPNGKLDRNSLPKPDASTQLRAYVAPATELELRVAGIWQDVLKLDRVGMTDNFFELGGHSLLMTQVVVRVREQFGIEMPLREFFELPTLVGLSQGIQQRVLHVDPIQDELAKSLEALKRLTTEEIDELVS